MRSTRDIIRFKIRLNNKHNIILVIIDAMILFLTTFNKCQKLLNSTVTCSPFKITMFYLTNVFKYLSVGTIETVIKRH